MRLLRVWFVVLLAVLLPVRGALAATMPCAPPSAASGLGSHVHVPPSGSDVSDATPGHDHAAASHGHAAHDHGSSTPNGHDHSSQDKCNMCSASCSSPPLPSAGAGIDAPIALISVSYPGLSAPPTSHESGGQERPPRIS